MSTGDTGLWGGVVPGGPFDPLGGIDRQVVLDAILPTLHADTVANLTFWTESQLYEWMDEALKRLARVTGIFVGRDVSQATVPGQSSYTLPYNHVSTYHVSLGAAPLRPANTLELEMRNPIYRIASADAENPPSHWYEDLEGNKAIGITPVPVAVAPVNLIVAAWPTMIPAAGAIVQAPQLVAQYVAFFVIHMALSGEDEAAAPDVASAAKSMCDLLEQTFKSYWGQGL